MVIAVVGAGGLAGGPVARPLGDRWTSVGRRLLQPPEGLPLRGWITECIRHLEIGTSAMGGRGEADYQRLDPHRVTT
jgi:hypothetical protein